MKICEKYSKALNVEQYLLTVERKSNNSTLKYTDISNAKEKRKAF